MILKCRCGKEYRIKDKRAQSGEKFECKKCGKSIQVPLHLPHIEPPQSQSRQKSWFRGAEEDAADTPSVAQPSQAKDSGTHAADGSEERIVQLQNDLATTQEEISTLVANREKQLRDRDSRITALESDLQLARVEIEGLVAEKDESLQEQGDKLSQLDQDLSGTQTNLAEERARNRES